MNLHLTDEVKNIILTAADLLNGAARRLFMGSVVAQMGRGGQRRAEAELGWNRGVISKGLHELHSGVTCLDDFASRGRKNWEEHHPELEQALREIADACSETDPTFRTTRLYRRLTASEARRQLLEEKGFSPDQVPSERTLRRKMTALGFHPRKVIKSKPLRKIKETDAIFGQVHQVNHEADADPGTVRVSIDTKAVVAIGNLSRGGKSRQGEEAYDHDFAPDQKLTPFGLFRPDTSETWLYFSSGSVTADFMVDRLNEIWPDLKKTVILHADNGPENSGSRTQWLKRLVEFSAHWGTKIKLAYYPPYHSKYNPIERVFGVLENYWNGDPLRTVDKALGMAAGMTYKGVHPVVQLVSQEYPKGVTVNNRLRRIYEMALCRKRKLEKWAITIYPGVATMVCSLAESLE